jgi:hypothetical protein
MRKILFTFLLLISLMADAQINPKEGFIITNQKDTIYGLIDYRSNTVNAKECTFKANNESEYKTYAPGQISAYRFKETGKFYISKKYENEDEVFAEFLISGMMNLYRVEMGFRKIYYVENEEGKMVKYENMEEDLNYDYNEAKKRAQTLYSHVAKSTHATDDIKIGNMSDNQMIKMVRDYHADVCTSNEECIKYEYDEEQEGDVNKCRPTIIVGGGYATCINNSLWKGNKGGAFYTIGAGLDFERNRMGKGLVFQLSMLASYISSSKKSHNPITYASLNAGAMYRYGLEKTTRFTSRFGLSYAAFDGSIKSTRNYDYEDHYGSGSLGIYAGGGIEVPIHTHAVNFNIEYRCYNLARIHIIQGTASFRF